MAVPRSAVMWMTPGLSTYESGPCRRSGEQAALGQQRLSASSQAASPAAAADSPRSGGRCRIAAAGGGGTPPFAQAARHHRAPPRRPCSGSSKTNSPLSRGSAVCPASAASTSASRGPNARAHGGPARGTAVPIIESRVDQGAQGLLGEVIGAPGARQHEVADLGAGVPHTTSIDGSSSMPNSRSTARSSATARPRWVKLLAQIGGMPSSGQG